MFLWPHHILSVHTHPCTSRPLTAKPCSSFTWCFSTTTTKPILIIGTHIASEMARYLLNAPGCNWINYPVAGEVGNKYPVSSSQVGITWSHVLQCLPESSSETESWVPTVGASLRILPWLASCYSLFQVPIPLPVFSDITSQGNCLYSNPHLDCTWNPQIKPKGEDLTRGIFQNTRNNMLKRICLRARR